MKKLLALIMVLLMTMTVFVGCGEDSNKIISETYDEVEQSNIVLLIDAYRSQEGDKYDLEYIEFGEPTTLSSIETLVYEGGKTVAECFAEDGYEDLKFLPEDDENFLGWIEYEITVKVDEDGCEYNTYKKTTDELLTTEEVFNKVMPDHGMGYIAKWKNIPQEEYDYFEEIE